MPVLHPDLIITQCPHVSNHYIAPPKYVQLLWPIENKMKLKKNACRRVSNSWCTQSFYPCQCYKKEVAAEARATYMTQGESEGSPTVNGSFVSLLVILGDINHRGDILIKEILSFGTLLYSYPLDT